MPQVVALVDVYAPSAQLAEAFRRAGATLVRVQSTMDVPRVYAGGPVDTAGYADNIVHAGDLATTARAVAAHHPAAVVAGGEVGVEFADSLAALLELPGNGVTLSRARRDKFVMIETVKAAGLAGARQLQPGSAGELAAWHDRVGGRIVVKPLSSAGGDSVTFCDSPAQAAAAYQKITAATNIFSQRNTGVVAQEYLWGTEYMVNTVSRAGRHHICDIWRTTRINANGVLDLADAAFLLRRRGEIQDRLAGYVCRVLDALGIAYGPAHAEIRLTESGPVLVEIGARICGGNLPYFVGLAVAESQLDWTVDAYLGPPRSAAHWAADYPVGKSLASVTLVSPVRGVLRRYRHLDQITALESFYDLRVAANPGDPIVPTVDDLGYPLQVTLMHDVEESVLRDAGTIRYLDGESFYELESDPPERAAQ